MKILTAILGASDKPERYSYLVMKELERAKLPFFLVNPRLEMIEGHACFPDLSSLPAPVHTLTLYVGPDLLAPLVPHVLALRPQRVIFNPGTESPAVQEQLSRAGIKVVEACSLVLLKTSQYLTVSD